MNVSFSSFPPQAFQRSYSAQKAFYPLFSAQTQKLKSQVERLQGCFDRIDPNNATPITIGRNERNTIFISAPHISRDHAVITLKADGYYLMNRSKNGIQVLRLPESISLQQEQEIQLQKGDQLDFGEGLIFTWNHAVPVQSLLKKITSFLKLP